MAQRDLRRVANCMKKLEEARLEFIQAIIAARDSGESLRDIAEAAGLSHQRIHQLVATPRPSRPDTGSGPANQ